MADPRFITASEVEGGVIPTGGSTNQVLAKQSSADFDLKWATGGGGGGGLAEWDSGTEYSEGDVVLDRDGLWQATGTSTDSQPVSGNTDWQLVGGAPYIDLLVTPPEQITPPFFQEGGVPGNDGVVFIPAPGSGKFVTWTTISSQTSDGSAFSDSGPHVFYQGLNDPDYSVNDLSNPSEFQLGAPDAQGPIIPVSSVENLPILIATSSQVPSTSTDASLLYRAKYQIHDVVPTQFTAAGTFYSIAIVDQGAKIFQLSGDLSSLTGAMQIVGSTGNDGNYTVTGAFYLAQPQNIIAVNQGTKTFTFAGDKTLFFPTAFTLAVAGSTGNDGFYSIDSSTFNTDRTDVVVLEDIPDSTADGTGANLNTVTDLVVAEAIPDATADGWVKP